MTKPFSLLDELRLTDDAFLSIDDIVNFSKEEETFTKADHWDSSIGTSPEMLALQREASDLAQGYESPFRSDEGIHNATARTIVFRKP